jgi:hypothetical protein
MVAERTAALLLTLALTASAQWLQYPTPGVPRLANGAPNLSARAPKLASGKPDFSGMWTAVGPEALNPAVADYPAAPEFRNLGAKLPGGLPYQPWAADLVKQRTAADAKDDPIGYCRPIGALRLYTLPPPRRIVQIADRMVILSERDVTFRQIFTDGRPLPQDPEPSFNGYSSGKWEGDTLVVQTVGFRDGMWIDRNGSPLTASATVTERLRRPDFGHLEIQITVDDPKAYTKPWTVTLTQYIVVDTELLDYFCQDNEKSSQHLQ